MYIYIDHKAASPHCVGGGAEVWESPTTAEAARWRVRAAERDRGEWGMVVERRESGGWSTYEWMVLAEVADRAAYDEWLERYVDYIEVDGHIIYEAG